VTTQRSPTEHQTAPTVNVFGGPNSPGNSETPANSIRFDAERAAYLQPFAGYRGEWAFAQAILETGHFTNSDTGINNYAGILTATTPDPASGSPVP